MREEELKPSGAAEAGRISSGQFHHGAGGSPGTNAHYSLAPDAPFLVRSHAFVLPASSIPQRGTSPSGSWASVADGPQALACAGALWISRAAWP